MKLGIAAGATTALSLVAGMTVADAGPRVLVNHVGYDARGSKKLIVQSAKATGFDAFQVIGADGRVVLERRLEKPTAVDRWTQGFFFRGTFSDLRQPGVYRIVAKGPDGRVTSERFAVAPRLLAEASISDVLYYLKSQRSSGEFDRADRRVAFFGETREPVDVRGGWFDAAGDTSKYLSHLSYTNFMNPQQTPLVVWALLKTAALLRNDASQRLHGLEWRLHDEALHGADFLVRMQDPAGYFYVTVFDRWTKDVKQREISAYATQEGHKSSEYQAGIREGGGMAIAALARAATLGQSGEFPASAYLAAAEKGFAHLQVHNLRYLDDHQENVIDDYCGLLAAVELRQATSKDEYLAAARSRRDSLVKRLHRDEAFSGFWRADATGDRPFFHAVDAGLPVVALLRYVAVEPDAGLREEATKAVLASLQFELAITREVANPFGYARQYVKDLGKGKRSAFFFPHQNESGYWWEGESARLASLAAAAFLGGRHAPPELRRELEAYAIDQLDWTFGLNPFDASMQRGQGRNTPDYSPDWPSAPGGVASGITSGFDDEHDIALLPPPHDQDPGENWRWSAQWLPHGAWLVLALAAQQAALSE
jgi:hypothetical protein